LRTRVAPKQQKQIQESCQQMH